MRAAKRPLGEGVPLEISATFKGFVRHLTGQQRSRRTIDDYSYVLARWGAFLGRTERHTLDTVALDVVQDYMDELVRVRGVDVNTVAHVHVVLRQWLRYLRKLGKCPLSPQEMELFEDEKPKTKRRKLMVDWNAVERMILDLMGEREPPANLRPNEILCWWRDHAIYAILFCTALRVSELVALNRSAVLGDLDYILVRGKGDKDREVPLSDDALFFARAYLSMRRDINPALFIRHKLKADQGKYFDPTADLRISVRQVEDKLLRDREFYGVVGLTPHKIRHLAATKVYKATGDIKVVQDYLGHASPATTSAIYTHVEGEYVRAKVVTNHPAFQKRKGTE